MNYPEIDPVIFSIGPLALRWYGLMYALGFLACYYLGVKRTRATDSSWSPAEVSDLIFYGVAGVVLGGRLGFVFFYGTARFLEDPLWALRIWEGGMSFHGGLLGVLVALALFARKTSRGFYAVSDFVAPLVPIGLGLGRIGNFINAELPGKVTDSALGVHFPCTAVRQLTAICFGEFETVTRHVSSLYQAFAEGVILFVVVWVYSSRHRPEAAVSGCFLIGYGLLRITTEFLRQPDAHIGFLAANWFTMGQLLSLPMVAFGIFLLQRRPART